MRALIAEAKRRARQRRLAVTALIVALAAIAAGVGFGLHFQRPSSSHQASAGSARSGREAALREGERNLRQQTLAAEAAASAAAKARLMRQQLLANKARLRRQVRVGSRRTGTAP